jgi:hypothetical protein
MSYRTCPTHGTEVCWKWGEADGYHACTKTVDLPAVSWREP